MMAIKKYLTIDCNGLSILSIVYVGTNSNPHIPLWDIEQEAKNVRFPFCFWFSLEIERNGYETRQSSVFPCLALTVHKTQVVVYC